MDNKPYRSGDNTECLVPLFTLAHAHDRTRLCIANI